MIPLLVWTMTSFSRFDFDAINEQCYNAKADYWDRFPFASFLPALVFRYHHSQRGNSVLDIGSGTGKLAEWLQKEGFLVECIDPSKEMVERCKQKGLSIQCTTLQEYVPQHPYGMIFAILSLIHLPKKELPSQLEKIHHSLIPEGLFVLTLLEGETEGLEEHASGYPRFFARYTLPEIRKLLNFYFIEIDYREVHAGSTYMTFFLKARA